MKLSHLSLAILSAIALSACGGGSSDHTKDPKPTPDPVPTEPTPDEGNQTTEEDKIVDPAQTGVVSNLDYNKQASVGAVQYIRREDSEFDRRTNPDKETSATSILSVNLNEQNPDLTNIVVARQRNKEGIVDVVRIQGNDREDAPIISHPKSLQNQNKHNVYIGFNGWVDNTHPAYNAVNPNMDRLTADGVGAKSTNLKDAEKNGYQLVVNKDKVENQLKYVQGIIKIYKDKDKADGLIPSQKKQLNDLENLSAELKGIAEKFKKKNQPNFNPYTYLLAFPSEYKATVLNWGDYAPTAPSVVNAEDSSTKSTQPRGNSLQYNESNKPAKNPDALGPQANGLVAMNYYGYVEEGNSSKIAPVSIQGTEEKSRTSTRIFGRNYDNSAADVYANSYLDTTTVILDKEFPDFANPDGKGFNEVSPNATANIGTLKYALAVRPLLLENVQYGRVTGDLDPYERTDNDTDEVVYQYAKYLNKYDEKSVDTYFYRGTNATTLDQMKALAENTQGNVLTYKGHALMYGIDNSYHGSGPTSLPNAPGVGRGRYGLGNFVEATFDPQKNRVEGHIYNVWHNPTQEEMLRDNLVRFDGNVHGNTVIGAAQRTYNTSDKADFRASFFGAQANELGGAINSTIWQDKFGAKGDVWGGVFGSKRTVAPQPNEGPANEQYGDSHNPQVPTKNPPALTNPLPKK